MIQRPDWFNEDLFPFESRSLEIDGSVVHLEGAGHYWQDDAGNEAVLAIRDWWNSIDG
jgi:hypothetical protein